MTGLQKAHVYLTSTLALLLTASILLNVAQRSSSNKKVVELQNQIASKDQTIELKEGLYHKLTLQLSDLTSVLDKKDQQQKELLDQLKKAKQDLLTSNTVIVGLKQQISKMSDGTQTEVPPENGKPARTKVDFHQDFGFVTVDGWTLTNPPQSWLRLNPGKPLTLTVSVAQDADKVWHSYVTSDNPTIGVDLKVAAVNPYVLLPKWYEGIGVQVGLGGGTTQHGPAALLSVGLNYKIKQFTIGPTVWFGINDTVDKYYGLTFEWRPFEKVK